MVHGLIIAQKMMVLHQFLLLSPTCNFVKLKQRLDTKIKLETTIFDLQRCATPFWKAETLLYLLITKTSAKCP